MIELSTRAMLIKVRVKGSVGTSKADEEVTEEVLEIKGATKDAGAFVKKLLKGYISEVRTAKSNLMKFVNGETSPWKDGEWRIFPVEKLEYIQRGIREKTEIVKEKLEDLAINLPEAIEADRGRLNGMFKLEDYPTPDQVRNKYKVVVRYDDISDPNDFRVKLANDVLKEIQESRVAESQEYIKGIGKDLANRLKTLLVDPPNDSSEGFIDRLHDSDPKFRESMLTRIVNTLETIQSLTVLSDIPELTEDLAKIRGRLEKFSTDAFSFNTNHIARKVVEKEINEVMSKMEGYF